ncbi:MAG: response regulator transcription factor [Lachnospiraceae bacterium]|nr:response regulator transcription factor [Lachnospiraceae bacterium]
MQNNRILLIEDDSSVCHMVREYLTGEGFSVEAFGSGSMALNHLQTKPLYDLALIDLMLPGVNGMELIKAIRKDSTMPIIIITAKNSDTDKSLGLNLGADDYVVKPFSLIELTARIKANIRRANQYSGQQESSWMIKDLEINPTNYTVSRQGRNLELTRTEFEILRILAQNPGQAFSKERLYELIWKEPYYGNEHVLNTHMNRLRSKLKAEEQDDTVYIKTLWGIGYKMEETR